MNLRRRAAEMKEITVDAVCENLELVTDFINDQLSQAGCPFRTQMQVDIVIDEIFSNIAKFAYAPLKGKATVRIETADREAVITFSDSGRHYNPLEQNEPDITSPLEEREIGGLGLMIVKKMMDDVRYTYLGGQNILQMRKRF